MQIRGKERDKLEELVLTAFLQSCLPAVEHAMMESLTGVDLDRALKLLKAGALCMALGTLWHMMMIICFLCRRCP